MAIVKDVAQGVFHWYVLKAKPSRTSGKNPRILMSIYVRTAFVRLIAVVLKMERLIWMNVGIV